MRTLIFATHKPCDPLSWLICDLITLILAGYLEAQERVAPSRRTWSKEMKLVLAVLALSIGLCAGVSLRENVPARESRAGEY